LAWLIGGIGVAGMACVFLWAVLGKRRKSDDEELPPIPQPQTFTQLNPYK
jgi:hypothetical protein